MSPVHLRNIGFQRNQPEDGERLSRTRRPGRGHIGHSVGWQDTEGNSTHSAIQLSIQPEPQTRGLERYGSRSSAPPPTPKRFISMKHGQQEVQCGIPLGRTWSKFPEDLSQRDRLQRPYSNHERLDSHQEAHKEQAKSALQWLHNIQEQTYPWPIVTILHNPRKFPGQEKTRIQWQKEDHLWPEGERVRPNDPEAVGFGERSAQEPEVVLNNSRISRPINRNITPTQIQHNVVTTESNLNSDSLWLHMSKLSEQTQKQFSELQASHERMKTLTASMDKIVKTFQEGHVQLSKASEETNKRLNLVFEEQHYSKRDRDCLDQDINKLFNVYHNMKPQQQGHVMDNPYHQDEIKPDAMLMNKERSPLQY
ncbi:hypothetical protein O181_123288 [Austropuccinia psidii MF-1]|uniref:Uncharacterized protein n=1 Tax=Austropuccinia psidii MF-1 TaxID=1389203 RepID=A0A9Q3KKV6_9BASI|nr:hypothetical protein [Austropuccinia psidii MF-1]